MTNVQKKMTVHIEHDGGGGDIVNTYFPITKYTCYPHQ